MPTPGEELSALNFGSMIGGPLIAVIQAQSQAAISSVNFIKSVGFDKDGNLIPVTFNYEKDVTRPDGTTAPQKFTLSVPILTMLPIPFIRIEETDIDFNAKIVSTETRSTDTSLGVDASLAAKAGFGPFSAELKMNFSYQKKTNEGSEVQRTVLD